MSDIIFDCPYCGKNLEVEDRGAGMSVPCPTCGKTIRIPPNCQANSESRTRHSKGLIVFSVAAVIAAIVFAGLWFDELGRKPEVVVKQVEVIKEVEKPVEVIKEVVKVVEVPAKLTAVQQSCIDFANRWLNAPFVEGAGGALYKLGSIDVKVGVDDAVKQVVSEERIKNKFELILRRHNIPLNEESPFWLNVTYEGVWGKDNILLTYSTGMALHEYVVVDHNGDMRRTAATIWREGSYGHAGKLVAEDSILKGVEEMAESFANTYLSVQQKTK